MSAFTNTALGIIEAYRTNGVRIWTTRGARPRGQLGYAVAAAKDWNRDGHADVLVTERSAGVTAAGAVLLYTGRADGLVLAATITPKDRQVRSEFGHAIASGGDINADGRPDLLVGAPRFTGRTASEAGRAFVYLSTQGISTAVGDWIAHGIQFGERFACSVCAGDFNHDGLVDVVVGARLGIRSGHRFGDVLVYNGSTNGLHRQPDWIVSGSQRNGEFGARIANAGDVNGDGIDDLLVGEPNRRDAGTNVVGRVVLLYGNTNGLPASPNWEVRALPPHTGGIGSALCAAGDLNQDGFADFALGAPNNKILRDYPGRVLVFYGARSDPTTNNGAILMGESAQDAFGTTVAGGGDFNGDGYPDLLVSAPRRSASLRNEGRVYLFRGGPDGLERSPVCTIDGGHTDMLCGMALCFAGDIDRDGVDDILIGSPQYDANPPVNAGRVDVLFGSRTLFVPVTNNAPHPIIPPPKVIFATPTSVQNRINRIKLLAVAGSAAAVALVVAVWYAGRRRQLRSIKAEQARIARDLHDNLSTQIALLAGEDAATAQATRLAIKDTIFDVDATRHNLESLVTFLGDYADQTFEGSGIRCLHDVPHELPDIPLRSEICKAVIAGFKEALANVLRHAQADEVWFRFSANASHLEIVVEDNGVGLGAADRRRIDGQSPETAQHRPAGDGLRNMRQRMTEIGGSCTVTPRTEGGTRVVFSCRF